MNPRQRRFNAQQEIEQKAKQVLTETIESLEPKVEKEPENHYVASAGIMDANWKLEEPELDIGSMKWTDMKKLGKQWKILKLHTMNKTRLIKALDEKAKELGHEQAKEDFEKVTKITRKLL